MIQILSVKEPERKKALCAKAGVAYSDALHVIASFDEKGEIRQSAVFQYAGEEGSILWMEDTDDDREVLIGLGKALLNIMDLRGVKSVRMPLTLEKMAQPLRFVREKDYFSLDLDGYFSCDCQHK